MATLTSLLYQKPSEEKFVQGQSRGQKRGRQRSKALSSLPMHFCFLRSRKPIFCSNDSRTSNASKLQITYYCRHTAKIQTFFHFSDFLRFLIFLLPLSTVSRPWISNSGNSSLKKFWKLVSRKIRMIAIIFNFRTVRAIKVAEVLVPFKNVHLALSALVNHAIIIKCWFRLMNVFDCYRHRVVFKELSLLKYLIAILSVLPTFEYFK